MSVADVPRFVWVLNANAELEAKLGIEHTANKKTEFAMAGRREKFLALTQGEPAFFPFELPRAASFGSGPRPIGLPWSTTLSVSRLVERLGYRLPRGPSNEVLRTVLSREFLVHSRLVGPPERAFVRTYEELTRHLELSADGVVKNGASVRTKRAFSSAGREQRVLHGKLVKNDLKFLNEGLASGGLLLEPELAVVREFSIHGAIRRDEALFGRPCSVDVDEYYSPLRLELANSLAKDTENTLLGLGQLAAEELLRAGYEGPFGLDVLETKDGFVPSDLNARFTLGWSIGLDDQRTKALDLLLRDA